MLAYIHVMPRQDAWVMLVNKDVQNDVLHSCTKPMHRIKSMPNMAHAPDSKVRTPAEQFLKTRVSLIRLVVSAAIVAPPNACSGDLNFWE